jgi:hypothetical protein
MTTTNLHRPEPLADFLDRGGDPRAELGDRWHMLFDTMVDAEAHPRDLEPRGDADRWHVEASLAHQGLDVAWGSPIPPITDQAYLTEAQWAADICEEPSLGQGALRVHDGRGARRPRARRRLVAFTASARSDPRR